MRLLVLGARIRSRKCICYNLKEDGSHLHVNVKKWKNDNTLSIILNDVTRYHHDDLIEAINYLFEHNLQGFADANDDVAGFAADFQ